MQKVNKQLKSKFAAQLVHSETGVIMRTYPPNVVYHMAVFDKDKNEGISTYSYGRYPHKLVFCKLGGELGGYIT